MTWWEFLLVMMVVVPVLVLWLGCIIDIIGRPDLSGVAKALWMLGVILVPIIGSLVYVITRPRVVMATGPGMMDSVWYESPPGSPNGAPRDPNSISRGGLGL